MCFVQEIIARRLVQNFRIADVGPVEVAKEVYAGSQGNDAGILSPN